MSTNMMTAGAVILRKDKWANILGVGIEWRDHGQDRWCRFINPINDSFNDRSGPGDCNRVELLRKFTAEKVYIGRSSNARINEGCRKTIEAYTRNLGFAAKRSPALNASQLSSTKVMAAVKSAESEERVTQQQERNTPLIELILDRTKEERLEVLRELFSIHPADVVKSASLHNEPTSYFYFPSLKLQNDMSVMFSNFKNSMHPDQLRAFLISSFGSTKAGCNMLLKMLDHVDAEGFDATLQNDYSIGPRAITETQTMALVKFVPFNM